MAASPLAPALAPGIGLKTSHVAEVLASGADVGFFEVHAENYMVDGGPYHRHLRAIRERYPLSLHGVALSIGGEEPLDEAHLDRLRLLIDRYEPVLFSEHLAWSSHAGVYYNDLLPLCYDRATLDRVCDHIDRAHERLGRRLLLENPSTYVAFDDAAMDEGAFMTQIVRRTGCGLLLDVNNVWVSAINHGVDPRAALRRLPLAAAGEIHLAGFAQERLEDGSDLLIDHHGSPVHVDVWSLYAEALALTRPLPTLVEWDNDVPALTTLVAEARHAASIAHDVFAYTEAA